MVIFWLILIIISLIIEALTFNLVTIWISLGALASYITSYFSDNVTLQIIVFFVVTTLTLIFTRRIVKRYLIKDRIKTNLDSVVGKTGIVIKDIIGDEVGRVKVMGKEWSAKSFDENTINNGTKVEILKIEGVKLIVKEVK